jgi:hypothetical protein
MLIDEFDPRWHHEQSWGQHEREIRNDDPVLAKRGVVEIRQ